MIIALTGLLILAVLLNLLMLVPTAPPFTLSPAWAEVPPVTRHRVPVAPGRDWVIA
jgi:hypothetical protein